MTLKELDENFYLIDQDLGKKTKFIPLVLPRPPPLEPPSSRPRPIPFDGLPALSSLPRPLPRPTPGGLLSVSYEQYNKR